MRTPINISEGAMKNAMRFTTAKTKKEAVETAVEAINRHQPVNEVVGSFGTWDIASHDEIAAGNRADGAAKS